MVVIFGSSVIYFLDEYLILFYAFVAIILGLMFIVLYVGTILFARRPTMNEFCLCSYSMGIDVSIKQTLPSFAPHESPQCVIVCSCI